MSNKIGAYLGTCNRQSAGCTGKATWYNHSTQKYYCADCAWRINDANPEWKREYGEKICTEGKPKKGEED